MKPCLSCIPYATTEAGNIVTGVLLFPLLVRFLIHIFKSHLKSREIRSQSHKWARLLGKIPDAKPLMSALGSSMPLMAYKVNKLF